MYSMKAMIVFYFSYAIIVSICWSQSVAKSQPSSSLISDKTDNVKQASGRSYTTGPSGVDPSNYMNQMFSHKPIDLLHLVPIFLILAFIPLVLPLIIQLFAGIITPFTPFPPHGRRKRDTNFHKNPEISDLLLDLATKVGDSFQKFNQFSK